MSDGSVNAAHERACVRACVVYSGAGHTNAASFCAGFASDGRHDSDSP